jgi:hypothetical protein
VDEREQIVRRRGGGTPEISRVDPHLGGPTCLVAHIHGGCRIVSYQYDTQSGTDACRQTPSGPRTDLVEHSVGDRFSIEQPSAHFDAALAAFAGVAEVEVELELELELEVELEVELELELEVVALEPLVSDDFASPVPDDPLAPFEPLAADDVELSLGLALA